MTTALAIVPPPQTRNPFDPSNLSEAMTLAKTLSTSQLIPSALSGKPQDILLIMIKGRELGLSTMQALSGINVIKGKAVMEAALLVGLILRHTDICEFFTLVESTPGRATYETRRRRSPAPVRMAFSIEEATKAGLTGKNNWRDFPAAMLRARAAAALGRAVYPDLVAGIYVPGEIPQDQDAGLAAPREVTAWEPPKVEAEPKVEPVTGDVVDDYDQQVFDGNDAQEPEEPAVEVARVPWGNKKGVAVTDLTAKDLAYYVGAANKALADESKARFHADEREWLQALQAEQKRREAR